MFGGAKIFTALGLLQVVGLEPSTDRIQEGNRRWWTNFLGSIGEVLEHRKTGKIRRYVVASREPIIGIVVPAAFIRRRPFGGASGLVENLAE